MSKPALPLKTGNDKGALTVAPRLCLDGVIYDPLIAILAGLIGWWIDISDGRNFACPFYANVCDYRANTGGSISLGASPMQRTEASPVTAVGNTQTLP
jgi:hypothetical protein